MVLLLALSPSGAVLYCVVFLLALTPRGAVMPCVAFYRFFRLVGELCLRGVFIGVIASWGRTVQLEVVIGAVATRSSTAISGFL